MIKVKNVRLASLMPDGFVLGLIGCAALGSVLPAAGSFAALFAQLVYGLVVLLFFCHGLRLRRETVVSAFGHWKLHVTILILTFAVYPAIALLLHTVMPGTLPQNLWVGLLFLACVPSTVQSSIAFVSIAKGNVPAAVAQASLSNVLGAVVTPLVAAKLLSTVAPAISMAAVGKVCLQLLVPFAAGHLLRPILYRYAEPHLKQIALLDKATILCVVYGAFSAATLSGVWMRLSGPELAFLIILCSLLLVAGLVVSGLAGRLLGFDAADRTTIFYAGTLKSLATGIPIAQLILPAPQVGLVVLPLMIFHQIQLVFCGWLAARAAVSQASTQRIINE